MSRAGFRNVGVLVTLYTSIRNSRDCLGDQPGHLRDAEIDAPLIGADDGVPPEVAERGPGALERIAVQIVVRGATVTDPSVVWSSCVAPGARLGRGFVVETSTALNSPSVTVNGPAGLEGADPGNLPALDELVALEGQIPRPAQNQAVLAVVVRQALVQLGPGLVVLDLEEPLVREVVDGA